MLWKLLLLLTVVPLVELLILIQLTLLWDSVLLTVCLVVATGVVGALLARREGLRVVGRLRQRLSRGELPADSLLDGVFVLVAGALLVTPGVLTDITGFLLLVPFTRAGIRRLVKRWIRGRLGGGGFFHTTRWRPVREEPPAGSPPLEEEGRRHTDEEGPAKG